MTVAGTRLLRPWALPGRLAYARQRIARILRPPVTVTAAPPGLRILRDQEIVTRDGTVLRANVFLPAAGPEETGTGERRHPVVLCAHPYGKDAFPKRTRRGWRPSPQYRIMRQASPLAFSELTTWESPDPVTWTGFGYAKVELDLRGAGASDGRARLMSTQEGQDVADAIAWAAAQPWSTGAVGLLGVSYLAISQWQAAAEQPAALKAIVPWEGFTDAYRDLFTPGGVRERGFSVLWTTMLRRGGVRLAESPTEGRNVHPLRDAWWQAMVPDLARIDVPMLVCASFSDASLHSRGSWRAFEHVASAERVAWTHRGGKWASFYSPEAVAAQRAFLDRHVRGEDAPRPPAVRLEVRERGDAVAEVRAESEWPLARTRWTRLALGPAGLAAEAPEAGALAFSGRRRAAGFTYRFEDDTELSGPMALGVWVSVERGADATVFAGVEKLDRDGRVVDFEGSYGYGRDLVASGMLRASLRRLDPARSTPAVPVHTLDQVEPLVPGVPVELAIPLNDSATRFRAGESLRLLVSGRQLRPRNPLWGQFPSLWTSEAPGRIAVHWGPAHASSLLVPVIPG
ncbi:MAG: CocE/NonD family hydrolase [Microbacteriaceae bacterium]|nr:CocE/NonD family hydrolase [Microbacteriaceae bacterium]